MFKNGRTAGYYNILAGSYGLQAGIQSFSYVLFFMDNESLNYLNRSEGWEIGVDPSIVVVDKGRAKSLTTTAAKSGVYAYIFSQKGLMAGEWGCKVRKLAVPIRIKALDEGQIRIMKKQ